MHNTRQSQQSRRRERLEEGIAPLVEAGEAVLLLLGGGPTGVLQPVLE